MRYQLIPAGTRVRVLTKNGGDTETTLSRDYVDTYTLYADTWFVQAPRIKRVDIVGNEPAGTVRYA